MKLTKKQKARAKAALIEELAWDYDSMGVSIGSTRILDTDPEWPEVQRLIRVAQKAVRGAK